MIRANIDSNGVLTLQADTEIEAFALGEWQRRKKLGKAVLEVITEVPIKSPSDGFEYKRAFFDKEEAIKDALTNGPKT